MTKELDWLYEYNYKDLLRGADSTKKGLAKDRSVHYSGLFQNVLKFTSSGTEVWTQQIRLLDLDTALKLKGTTLLDRVRLAVSGDLEVYCDCPSWMFQGFAYMATELGYGFKEKPERRFPKIRNKNLTGTCCKHLIVALQTMSFYSGTIAANIKQSPTYKKYVPVQESYPNQYYPINESKLSIYEHMGKIRYMSVPHLVSNLSSSWKTDTSVGNDLIMVSESASGKFLYVKGSDVLVKASAKNYSNVPVLILK